MGRQRSFQETYFWSTLVLSIGFVALLVLFIYKMFFSPRQVIVSLEKASNRILVPDPPPPGTTTQSLPGNEGGKPGTGKMAAGPHHNWSRHLTLSLAVLSAVLGFMLGWDFENNVYAQDWVAQNLSEVGLIALAVILGVVLLPLAIILVIGFLGQEKKKP